MAPAFFAWHARSDLPDCPQERRITRAWLRESAGDREILEKHFNYTTDGNGVTIMTPKAGDDAGRTAP